MHFVDQVDLVSTAGRCVLHVVEQLARVVDLGARRGIDLDQIDEAALVYFAAGRAFAAWSCRHTGLAVEALGEDARDGRLADAASSGEQERVVHPPLRQRIAQRHSYVLLPDEFGEGTRPPFARKREITHARQDPVGGGSPHQPDFGARHRSYRCSLPGLTGFTTSRREGADTDCHGKELADRVGFEPTNTVRCYLLSNQAPSTARPPVRDPLLPVRPKDVTGRA